MMIFNISVGPARMQINNTQKINNSDISTQDIPNSHVCYSEKSNKKKEQHGRERIKRAYS